MALDRRQVVDEALRLLDDKGLDGLSLRVLAGRLGVQAPTLYWHIGSKAELIDALADAIMDEAIRGVPDPAPDGEGREWLLTALVELRKAMFGHRDGARTVAGARLSLRRGDFSELAMATLLNHGVERHQARLLVLAGERFTLGYVLEEQSSAEAAQRAPDVEELRQRFPVLTEAIAEYFSTQRTPEGLYRDIARLVLNLPPEG